MGPILKDVFWLLTVPCGLRLCHFAVFFFFTKKTNEENVFLFINVTQYRKLAEKIGTFLKCESWKSPHSGLVQGRHFASPSGWPHQSGFDCLECMSVPPSPPQGMLVTWI